MRKMAIVTPGLLPVPAVDGGAVETLITYLVEGNEKNPQYNITLYTCKNNKLDSIQYQYTKIVQINSDGILRYIAGVLRRLKNIIPIGKNINAYLLFLKLVNWNKYESILVENSMTIYELLCSCRGTKGKLSYHMHNDMELEIGDKSPKRTKLVVDTAQRIFTCSEYIKRRILEVQETDKIQVLYNCVDLDLFQHRLDDERELRVKLGYDENDFIVMYSGRIVEEKGTLELCKAMKPLCLAHENIKLLVVGCCWFPDLLEGPYWDEIQSVIAPFKEQVIFTGFVDMKQIVPYYEISSMIAIPTTCEEAFGMVSLEAQIMGLPIVATNSGGLVETMNDKCAIVVDKEDGWTEKFSQAIRYLYENPNVCIKMGQAGQRHIKEKKAFHKEEYFGRFVERFM